MVEELDGQLLMEVEVMLLMEKYSKVIIEEKRRVDEKGFFLFPDGLIEVFLKSPSLPSAKKIFTTVTL